MEEFSLIAEFFAPLARGAPGSLGLADDAALIEVATGRRLVVTTDMMVSGVHFLASDPPRLVGKKLLRVNLSDLAAMGATPRAYLLAIAIPVGTDDGWLREFAVGLGDDQAAYGVSLIGGDTVATEGALTVSVTAFGDVREGEAMLRSGARAGDLVFVSGTLGDAALGLVAARGRLEGVDTTGRATLVERFRLPLPRIELGGRLSGLAHAAIDISDGLVADLGHICTCSGVGMEVEADHLPLSAAARTVIDSDGMVLNAALSGGDDYEIAFTCPADATDRVMALSNAIGLPITQIGRVVDGSDVTVFDKRGRKISLQSTGYRHF